MRKEKQNVVATAVHEISHFIFYEYLKEIEREKDLRVSKDVEHYLKEGVTTALFNEEPLRSVLNIQAYPGNPELHCLQIEYLNKKGGFVDFIRRWYRISRKSKKPFKDLLMHLAVIVNQCAPAFSRKWKLWNRYGKALNIDPKLRARYQTPVKIKKAQGNTTP